MLKLQKSVKYICTEYSNVIYLQCKQKQIIMKSLEFNQVLELTNNTELKNDVCIIVNGLKEMAQLFENGVCLVKKTDSWFQVENPEIIEIY